MALSDKKILTSERNAVYVKSNAGKRLTGTTEQNKDAFDKFPQLIMDKYNELIDLLTALGLDSIDTDLSSRYTKAETDAAIATETNDLVETITYTAGDGKFTITTKDGTSTTIDTNIEKIPASFELIEEDGKTYLKITNDDGSTSKTDVSSLVNIYSFSDSDTIDFTENSGQVTAVVKNNSITLDHLSLAVVSTIEGYVSAAASSASSASASASAAEQSAGNASTFEQSAMLYAEDAKGYKDEAATNASNSASNAATAAQGASQAAASVNQAASQAQAAANSATLSKSYAQGGTGTRAGEDTNNAKYYMEQAAGIVSEAGLGDMLRATYDPQGKAQDIFAYADPFIAVYGETTFAEVEEACKAGKTVLCRDQLQIFPLVFQTPFQFQFSGGIGPRMHVKVLNDGAITWDKYILTLPPIVTTDDAGKVLTVSGSGIWEAAELAKEYTATTTTTWTDATGYYTQSVTVTGLLEADNPIVDLITTTENFEAEQEAWGKVFKVTTATDSITFYASEAITTELNLQIKVVR